MTESPNPPRYQVGRDGQKYQRKSDKVKTVVIDVTVKVAPPDKEGDMVADISVHRHGTLTFEGEGILTKSELEILVRKLQTALSEA